MAAVSVRIDRALRLIGAIGAGETPTDDERADALVALNAMLDTWRNEKLMCYARQDETLTLSNGDGSYSVGPSGDLVTTRPVEIVEAYIVSGDITYEVRMIDEAQWAAIPDKSQQNVWPTHALYRPTMPNGTLLVWPVPNGSRSLKLVTRVVAGPFTAVTDSVTFPPGWESAIDHNLAIEIAPEYDFEPPAAVVKRAKESLAGIKLANAKAQPNRVTTELAEVFGARSGNIYSDAA